MQQGITQSPHLSFVTLLHRYISRTVEAFKTVGPELIRRLHTIYQIDFEMFGYSAIKYLDITEFNID